MTKKITKNKGAPKKVIAPLSKSRTVPKYQSQLTMPVEKSLPVPPAVSIAGPGDHSTRPMLRLGVSGYTINGGYIVEHERNSLLTGSQKYVTFANILANTSVVAAGVRFYLNLVAKAQFKIHPINNSEEAKAAAELVQLSIDKSETPWSRIVRRGAMYRFYGFALQEWVARRLKATGEIIMGEVGALPQFTVNRWDVDNRGRVLGVEQLDPNSSVPLYIPRSKLVYVTDDVVSASPEGLGIFRHLVEPATRLSRYEQLEDFGFETDLRGIPIVRAPLTDLEAKIKAGTLSEEQRDALLLPFRQFLVDHWKNPQLGMLLDSEPYRGEDGQAAPIGGAQYGLEILQGQTTGQNEIARALERINREIARVLGTEHLLLGDGEGSQALSRDKSQNFAAMIDGSLIEVADSLRRDYMIPLMRLNGISEDYTPTIRAEQVRFREVEQITASLKDMSTAGVILAPNDPAINEIRELLGLSSAPEIDQDAVNEIIAQQMMAQQNPGQGTEPMDDIEDDTTKKDGRRGGWSPARKAAHSARMRIWAKNREKAIKALEMKE